MNGITRFGLDASRLTIVFIALVIVAGLLQFMEFPRQEDPPIVIREVVVSAQFPGMKPEDVEQLITEQIEAELRAMPEIDDIWSDSKTGVAVVHADTADEYDDVDAIWQKVRNRMLDLAPKLPAGTIGPFVNDEFGLVAVATIALWTEGFTMGRCARQPGISATASTSLTASARWSCGACTRNRCSWSSPPPSWPSSA